MLIFINDRFVEAEKAFISAEDRGFRFGDGVFETIPVYGSVPYQWDFHLKRLSQGLQALHIERGVDDLRGPCNELIRRNGMPDCTLRMAISRGVGSRGYLPLPGISPTLVIETTPRPEMHDIPFTLWLSKVEKISAKALPVHCKLSQGVNPMLARMEAEAHGCVDGLQLNASGQVCETSSANILWLKGGVLHTPALSCGVLNGATRHALLKLSPWPVREGAYTLEDLHNAEAVMTCGSIIQVLAINALHPQGWQWDSVAHAQQLREVLQQDIKRECKI